jgi:hypothetical protein
MCETRLLALRAGARYCSAFLAAGWKPHSTMTHESPNDRLMKATA